MVSPAWTQTRLKPLKRDRLRRLATPETPLYPGIVPEDMSLGMMRAMSKAELLSEIRRLPFAERVELLEELWNETETEHPELLEWQKVLLDQRLKDAETHSEDWVSWDETKQRLEWQLHDHWMKLRLRSQEL